MDDAASPAIPPATGPASGTPDAPDEAAFALAFEQAFQRTYLQFHRRDSKRSALPPASRAVLVHLAHAGPLTIGEMTAHLDRAQSVVSDVVTGLERRGLVDRRSDPADRRQTLVWLTDDGLAALATDRQVLSVGLLRAAARALPAEQRAGLLDGLGALLAAPMTRSDVATATTRHPTRPTTTPTDEDGARP